MCLCLISYSYYDFKIFCCYRPNRCGKKFGFDVHHQFFVHLHSREVKNRFRVLWILRQVCIFPFMFFNVNDLVIESTNNFLRFCEYKKYCICILSMYVCTCLPIRRVAIMHSSQKPATQTRRILSSVMKTSNDDMLHAGRSYVQYYWNFIILHVARLLDFWHLRSILIELYSP